MCFFLCRKESPKIHEKAGVNPGGEHTYYTGNVQQKNFVGGRVGRGDRAAAMRNVIKYRYRLKHKSDGERSLSRSFESPVRETRRTFYFFNHLKKNMSGESIRYERRSLTQPSGGNYALFLKYFFLDRLCMYVCMVTHTAKYGSTGLGCQSCSWSAEQGK